MTTITGILEGIFSNEKSDAIKVGGRKVTLKKGEGNNLLNMKGKNIQIEVKEGTWQGKTTYLATSAASVVGGNIPVNKNNGNTRPTQMSVGTQDPKQESICFQSALKASLEFSQLTYGKSEEEKQFLFKEVLRNAYKLARLSIHPDLFRPNPNQQSTTSPSGPVASSGDDYTEESSDDIENAVM